MTTVVKNLQILNNALQKYGMQSDDDELFLWYDWPTKGV